MPNQQVALAVGVGYGRPESAGHNQGGYKKSRYHIGIFRLLSGVERG
jgi:hypothetical protein